MKFIIRDDDVNYHYQVGQLSKWYEDIVDICPISICIPPFIEGDFFDNIKRVENHNVRSWEEMLSEKSYKLGDNEDLVNYLKELVTKGHASIGLHGIKHRNKEPFAKKPKKDNYIWGAEFYTENDYTIQLGEAKKYLENELGTEVNYFTAPQNMVNLQGLKAIINNKLSLCTDLIFTRDDKKQLIKLYGIWNCAIMWYYKKVEGHPYPFIIRHKTNFIDHFRLQPGKSLEHLKNEFEFARKKNGVFVLSTHSYDFDHKMDNYDMTMKEALIDILHYTQQYKDIEYTTLHDLFKDK